MTNSACSAVYISQHVMLVGITLPFYAVFSTSTPFTAADWAIATAALGSISLAYFADTQVCLIARIA